MDPNTVYSAGHELKVRAKLAHAHLAACKADSEQCDPLADDLNKIAETSENLSNAALEAGAKP